MGERIASRAARAAPAIAKIVWWQVKSSMERTPT